MSNHIIIDAISNLDADLLEHHLEAKEKLKSQRKKRPIIKWLATAACLILALSVFVPLAMNENGRSKGDMGEYRISLTEVIAKGEPVGIDEAKNYLLECENEILTLVSSAEKISVDELMLSSGGIYHVTLTEEENFINYDMITFYVFTVDGAIVSTVDLYRNDGKLNFQVNGSGVITETMNHVLSQNQGVEFILIYIDDFTEAMIAPNNTVYFLNGKKEIIGDLDFYSLFNLGVNVINSEWFN